MARHISEQFEQELGVLCERVLEMGGLVEQQLRDACRALATADLELAASVRADDAQVNKMELELDEMCTNIIARRQPAASDLRLIMVVVKTITDLERIGDESCRIAKMAEEAGKHGSPRSRSPGVQHIASHVMRMVADALDAFARTDRITAQAVIKRDAAVDDEYEAVIRQLITVMMEDPRTIRHSISTLWSARALERIGDHATNICEYVVYLVDGRDVRHQHNTLDNPEEPAGPIPT